MKKNKRQISFTERLNRNLHARINQFLNIKYSDVIPKKAIGDLVSGSI